MSATNGDALVEAAVAGLGILCEPSLTKTDPYTGMFVLEFCCLKNGAD